VVKPNAVSNTERQVSSRVLDHKPAVLQADERYEMNNPMPTAMANFSDRGMAFSSASRRLVSTRI
jgi:hypothetical protein